MPQNPNFVCAMGWYQLFMIDCIKSQARDLLDHNLSLTRLGRRNVLITRSALAWHPIKEGYILGSNGNTICLWDINSALAEHNRVLGSMQAYEHTVIIF